MDQSAPLTAFDVVNGWSQEELRRILWQYGEERYSGPIAAAIVRAREQAPIQTTGQLADLIRGAMPAKARREKQHPAKRSFQAIRIAVNDELGEVERMLDTALNLLRPGGRIAVISFHSLEDRLGLSTASKTGARDAPARRISPCACAERSHGPGWWAVGPSWRAGRNYRTIPERAAPSCGWRKNYNAALLRKGIS